MKGILTKQNEYIDWLKSIGCDAHVIAGSGSQYVRFNSQYAGCTYIRVSDHLTSKKGYLNVVLSPITDNVIVSFRNYIWTGEHDISKHIVYTLIMSHNCLDADQKPAKPTGTKITNVVNDDTSAVATTSAKLIETVENTAVKKDKYSEKAISKCRGNWTPVLGLIIEELYKISDVVKTDTNKAIIDYQSAIQSNKVSALKNIAKKYKAENIIKMLDICSDTEVYCPCWVKQVGKVFGDNIEYIKRELEYIDKATNKLFAVTVLYKFNKISEGLAANTRMKAFDSLLNVINANKNVFDVDPIISAGYIIPEDINNDICLVIKPVISDTLANIFSIQVCDKPDNSVNEVKTESEENCDITDTEKKEVDDLIKTVNTINKIKSLKIFSSLKAGIRDDILELVNKYPNKYSELVELLNQIKRSGYGTAKCKLKILAFKEYCESEK